jgi:hypothetical protein
MVRSTQNVAEVLDAGLRVRYCSKSRPVHRTEQETDSSLRSTEHLALRASELSAASQSRDTAHAKESAVDDWPNDAPVLPSDGRVTNGGKGIAYLRDYFVVSMLNHDRAPQPAPVAGN